MTAGQVLFKKTAIEYHHLGTIFKKNTLLFFAFGCFAYTASLVIWLRLLQTGDLSKLYPFFALGFVFVPLAAVYFFDDHLGVNYVLGVVLVLVGIVLTSIG